MDVKIGSKYRHYKGKDYKVIAIAKNSETLEDMVVYEALYDNHQIWARPLNIFFDQIEPNKKRFEIIE